MQTGEAPSFEPDTPRRWRFAGCEYTEINRQLLVRGEPVKMETKPLDVLQLLLENPKRVLSKDELIGGAWDTPTSDESLATAIRKLRKAFGGDRDAIILNVSGIGYRMAVPVVCLADNDAAPPAFHLQPGDPVPGCPLWKTIKPLGFGSPALVWLCEHATREQNVFKFATDGIRLRALQREVTVSRLLQHDLAVDDRFVRVAHWQLEQAPFFIRSDYCGQNLLECETSPDFAAFDLDGRISLIAEIADAVAAAHSLGVLHNDLKPSNILVLSPPVEGSGWKIRISDFGIASVSQPQRLRDLQITYHQPVDSDPQSALPLGTAMYRAPELGTGAAPSVLADVYALGVMLYQIACGDFLEPPSPGWDSRISDPLLQKDIADAANIDPKFRIPNAADLARRLRTIEARRAEQLIREKEVENHRRAQQLLAAQRVRQPWIIATICALTLGLFGSIWFYVHAVNARNNAERQTETASAIYGFLSHDLLEQSDPLSGAPARQTLLQAIDAAAAQIDRRFQDRPEIAGRLHETIADALNNRAQFPKAREQYLSAAECFRRAQGEHSQSAIIADLKREAAALRSMQPGSLDEATRSFAKTQRLMQGIRDPEPEVRAWFAATQAGLLGSGPHPEQAIPVLKAALDAAQKTPDVNPRTVLLLRQRLCFLYLRSGDGPGAEKTARAMIQTVVGLDGPESPALLFPELNHQEALVIGGRFKDAVAETTRNYPHFLSQLGPANQMTLQTIATRAVAEGELQNYAAAIRDDLAVHQAAPPSNQLFRIGTLADAATSECRVGRFSSGLDHAREALRETHVPGTSEVFVSGSALALSECMLSSFESSHQNPQSLNEAEKLLKSIDIALTGHFMGDPGLAGNVDVAEARLAFDRGQYVAARKWADKARPYLNGPGADAYEKKQLDRINQLLSKIGSGSEPS